MGAITGVSHEEYFELLAASDVKLEYHGGEIVAMAGAQTPHNILASRINRFLGNCLEEKGCYIMTSDQVVAIPECDKFLFPDIVITCKDLQLTKNKQGLDALQNPEIIVEILSDTTEIFDRNEKFDCYQTIASLREYVLVNTKRNKVEVFKKIGDNEWLLKTYLQDEDEVEIDECRFLIKQLYKNIEKVRSPKS